MNFLLDENAESRIGGYLRRLGHDVTAITADYQRSAKDTDVRALAHAESRILVTNDRDFLDLALRRRRPHSGIIIFRLGRAATVQEKIDRLQYLLDAHAGDVDAVIVVTSNALIINRPERDVGIQ